MESPDGGTTGAPGPGAPRIKISDFGLARNIIDSESMALTAAGALLGTPHYMAPEQWTGRAIDARTDIYAMGATLYHLLAGAPPFDGPTRDVLAAQHCQAQPPPLAAANPAVSEGVVRVVERAMAKLPEDRYVNAGAMLRDLEALLHGEPTGIPMHPILPACDPDRVLPFEFRWELESSPRQLWPLVTNTDRLDRAIGFPAMKYSTRYEEGRGVRTFAEGRKAGMTEVGEEHPYEWVEPRRMGVMREYSQGPFVWLVSSVELLPRAGGGTTLVHRLHIEPRTWTIRVGSKWGVGGGLRKSLEKVYRRIDATLQGRAGRDLGASAVVDPFEEPDRLPAVRRHRLERLLDRLSDCGVNAAVVERLSEYLVLGSAQEVARIRPLALAARFGLDPDQVVAACLHGAREGLLELHWDLLCPVCRISCQVTDTLRAIAEHAHCAGLPPRLPARLRQLDRADLPGASRDPRGRPGDLLRRRAGAFAARAGAGPRGAGRATRAGARAARGPVSAPRPATALDGQHPGPRLDGPAAMGARPGAGADAGGSRRPARRRPGAGPRQRARPGAGGPRRADGVARRRARPRRGSRRCRYSASCSPARSWRRASSRRSRP